MYVYNYNCVSLKHDVIVSRANMRQKDVYHYSMHCYLISVTLFFIHISKTRAIRALVQCQTNHSEKCCGPVKVGVNFFPLGMFL